MHDKGENYMNYREQINDLLDRQDRKGLSKYGLPLEQSRVEIAEKLNHLAEELIDGLRYVLWVMDELCVGRAGRDKRAVITCCNNCHFAGRPTYVDPCATCSDGSKFTLRRDDNAIQLPED